MRECMTGVLVHVNGREHGGGGAASSIKSRPMGSNQLHIRILSR
jgi:hypothetical protein